MDFMTWGYAKPSAEKISQDPDWYYTTKIGSLRFLRIQELDSLLSKKKVVNSYISITDLKPVSSENNRYFVLNDMGETNWVDYDRYQDQIKLPVNASTYSLAKTTAFTILGISIAIALWTGIVLSRFALTAKKEHFFTSSNMT